MSTISKGYINYVVSGLLKVEPYVTIFLQSCWNMTATKRPTASEIVELLSNNPRLISPCIDVPLASVQVERTDSLELIPSVRKPSGSVSQTNRPVMTYKKQRDLPSTVNENSFGSNISGPYSPMSGVPCGNGILMNGGVTSGSPGTSHPFKFVDMSREPLLSSSHFRNITPPPVGSRDGGSKGGSYVPPGYILVDHTTKSNSTVTSPERQNGRGTEPVPVWYLWGRRDVAITKLTHDYITVTVDWYGASFLLQLWRRRSQMTSQICDTLHRLVSLICLSF